MPHRIGLLCCAGSRYIHLRLPGYVSWDWCPEIDCKHNCWHARYTHTSRRDMNHLDLLVGMVCYCTKVCSDYTENYVIKNTTVSLKI